MTTGYLGSISGSHYRSLIQNLELPVMLHTDDDHVVDVNRAFADFLGFTLPEARRLDPRELVHPAQQPEYDHDQSLLVSGSTLSLTADYDLIRKNGAAVRVRVKKSVARHNAETVVMTIVETGARVNTELAHPISIARIPAG
ncbi:PAS domain S-box protein [Rhodococcus sp. NPDC003318]|uniref:PAS domain S-box protein n=1 Tax=Rhodococcus sp. NPDC003318 TaxID=3364503 RepID=UPI0036AAA260